MAHLAHWQLWCSKDNNFFLSHVAVLISVCAAREHRVTQIVLTLTTQILDVVTSRLYTAVYLCTSNTCNVQEKLLCLLARKRRSSASSSWHTDFRRWKTACAAWRTKIGFTPWKRKGKSENLMEIVIQRQFSKEYESQTSFLCPSCMNFRSRMTFQTSLRTSAGFVPDLQHFFRTGTSARTEEKHLDTKPSCNRSHLRTQPGTFVVTTCLLSHSHQYVHEAAHVAPSGAQWLGAHSSNWRFLLL